MSRAAGPRLCALACVALVLAGCAQPNGGPAASTTAQVSSSTAAPLNTTGVAPSQPKSPYEGTYMGMFQYTVRGTKDDGSEFTLSSGFRLTAELAAGGTAPGPTGWTMQLVRVQASDPFFGCEMGCVPASAGVLLPAEPPTTPSRPSEWGQGLTIEFPNGSFLQTNAGGTGYVHVTTDARTVSNDLSVPAGDRWQALVSTASQDWSDDVISGRPAFHADDCPNGCGSIGFDSWSLTRSGP